MRVLLTILLIATLSLTLQSQEPGQRQPLDLPAGGGTSDDTDEDAPEAIRFWGSEYEGDSFFFCCDVSGSMNWRVNGMKPITLLRWELADAIRDLSSRTYFDIITFSDYVQYFKPKAIQAKKAVKAQAIAWFNSINPRGTTNMLDGMLWTMQIRDKHTRPRHSRRSSSIILITDGLVKDATPEAFINRVTIKNQGGMHGKINGVYVLGAKAADRELGKETLKTTTQANRGSYREGHVQ